LVMISLVLEGLGRGTGRSLAGYSSKQVNCEGRLDA
jgi:hypothetical protein